MLRIIVARADATLEVNGDKCKVLVPLALVGAANVVMEPLRRNGVGWDVVTHMRVLGVMLTDPASGPSCRRRVEASMSVDKNVRVPEGRLSTPER